MIRTGEKKLPRQRSPKLPDLTAKETFKLTCVDWPHNTTPMLGKTSECCWQWVEDG